jgi:hypothetical protein
MPASPTPGGKGGAGQWWAVYSPGQVGKANTQYSTALQAGNSSEAEILASETTRAKALGIQANELVTFGPFATESQARARLRAAHIGGWAPYVDKVIGSALGSVTKALGLSQFLGNLSSRNTLMRIGEGALGVALIIVGVAKLADGTPLGSALKKVPFV